jgi:hypothetical protein
LRQNRTVDDSLAWVSNELQPDGWIIETEPSTVSDRIQIRFDHPLSTPHVLSATTRGIETAVREFLDARVEFRLIRDRPTTILHGKLIRDLRKAAAMNRWPPSILGDLAQLLQRHELLTPSEAEWLTVAGAPWHRDGNLA